MLNSCLDHQEGPRSLWRWVELASLSATIPGFYLSMLSSHRAVSVALYLAAGCATALVSWNDRRGTSRSARDVVGTSRRSWSGFALVAALVLCAFLSDGDGTALLAFRLGTSTLMLLRLADPIRPWFWRGSLPHLLVSAIGILGLCGLGFLWLEPRVHTLGDGLWLAFTTAATVGYGDIVPSTPASKIFAVFVVLMGFAVLSLVTASIAAMWVKTEERRIEDEILRDVHSQLRVIRDELAALRRERDPETSEISAVRACRRSGESG